MGRARKPTEEDGAPRADDVAVTLAIDLVEAHDTSALARSLTEQQESKAGAHYAYCTDCLAAVSSRTARTQVQAGKPVRCRPCVSKAVGATRRDPRTFLCAHCRAPLTGERLDYARKHSRHGGRTTCGAPACVAALREEVAAEITKPRPPCAECGAPVSKENATYARRSGSDRVRCDAHKPLRSPVPLLPCVTCGRPTSKEMSKYAKRHGAPAYCDEHKRKYTRREEED